MSEPATTWTLLDELAAYVAAGLSLHYATVPDGQQRELFIGRMDRRDADPTASVIRASGGPAGSYDPIEGVSVQVLTQGPTEAAALARAEAIWRLFFDADGYPVRNLALTAWRLLAIDAQQRPTPIGVNESGGVDVSFNWLIRAHRRA